MFKPANAEIAAVLAANKTPFLGGFILKVLTYNFLSSLAATPKTLQISQVYSL